MPGLHLACIALFVVGHAVAAAAQPQPSTTPQAVVVTLRAQDVGVAPSDEGRDIGGQMLFYLARYHPGDNPAWADPAFDDHDWEIASTGLGGETLPQQGWPGIGWFRVRLRIDESLQNETLGFVFNHSGAIEAYLDGTRVYQSGTVGTTPDEETPYRDLNPVVLPLEPGQEHVLALRYSSFGAQGFRAQWYYTGFSVWWGDWRTMLRHRGFVRFSQGIFVAFFLAFALLFGLLYALYRSERPFLYLAIYYSLLGPYAFLLNQMPYVEAPSLLMPITIASFVFAVGAMLATLRVVYVFFSPTLPRQFYGFLVACLAVIIATCFRLNNAIYLLALSFLVNLEILRMVATALWRKKRWAWIVGIGIVPSILIQLWSHLEVLGLLTTPWAGSPLNPNMIGILFVSAACTVYVGIRFADAHKGLAVANEALSEANRTLEDRVAQRTTALEASQAQLIHAEKMASLGQLTSGIAHEIKNPLNFINNFASLSRELLDELSNETDEEEQQALLADLKTNAEKIEAHGQRADGIVRSMLEHARVGNTERRDTDLNALVADHVDLARHSKSFQQGSRPIDLTKNLDPALVEIEVVPQEIGQVLLNLLGNAFDAVHERAAHADAGYVPTVTVTTRQEDEDVVIRVADNGTGIPENVQKKIFEPFYTTKPTGSGTGLGLSLSYDIITQGHGGTLTAESTPGHGATFTVVLPVRMAPPE